MKMSEDFIFLYDLRGTFLLGVRALLNKEMKERCPLEKRLSAQINLNSLIANTVKCFNYSNILK